MRLNLVLAVVVTLALAMAGCASLPVPREAASRTKAEVSVDFGKTVRSGADRFLGINLNYIRDADENRTGARPLNAALRDLHARWLRYPGGEKSDFIRWELHHGRMTPKSFGEYGKFSGTRMDFDAFVKQANAANAEPLVVVGYDSIKRSGRSEAAWIADAVALVRYANVRKRYGIRYWEIGNENWHNGTSEPGEMARTVRRFSQAMKAVDPSIQIGSSGRPVGWWDRFLPLAAPGLDFITVSHYNVDGWSGYRHWLKHPDANHSRPISSALAAIDRLHNRSDAKRLRVIVTETNSINWTTRGWRSPHSVGHALVSFDTMGKLLSEPRVISANLWTTRWIPEAEADARDFSALDPTNQLLPSGQMLAFWGRGLRSRLVTARSDARLVSAYASSGDGKAPTGSIWLVNKDVRVSPAIKLKLHGSPRWAAASSQSMFGVRPNDTSFRFGEVQTHSIQLDGTIRDLVLPPLSVTQITLRP